MRKLWMYFVLLVMLFSAAAHAEVAVPKLAHRVTDLTATLDAQQSKTLEAELAAFEARKGSQLAVLIVPTTQPETIEQFGIRVFSAWKLGRKKVDDGALLLWAKDDHKLRIEVGYGLEGALNDAVSRRIIAETITPYTTRGEFYAGIDAGVKAIIKTVENEPLPAKTQSSSTAGRDLFTLVIGTSLIILFGIFLSYRFLGKPYGTIVAGGISGGWSWLAGGSLFDVVFAALWSAVVCGIFAFSLLMRERFKRQNGQGGSDSFDSSSPSRSSSDSMTTSSDSGSDFSGGGGDSGGGGASGSD